MQTGWNGVLFSGQSYTLGAAGGDGDVDAAGAADLAIIAAAAAAGGAGGGGGEGGAEAAADAERAQAGDAFTAAVCGGAFAAAAEPNVRAPDPARWMRLIDPIAHGILIGF